MLAIPGLWFLHEPFNPNKGIWPDCFPYARPCDERPDIDSFVRELLLGRRRYLSGTGSVEHPLMPVRLLPQPFRRVLIKDPLACLLTPYLCEHFGVQTLVLFRHPCGFVSSILRLGWPSAEFVRRLLECDALMADHLAPVRDHLVRHSQDDGMAAAAALHGAINTVLWNTCRDRGLRYACFEDLCRDPLLAFREIFDSLGLPYDDSVRRMHEELCNEGPSDPAACSPHSVHRRSSAMAESWRSQLKNAEIDAIREVWDLFGIPLYESEADWATGAEVGVEISII